MPDTLTCDQCQTVNPADATLCQHCGALLVAPSPTPSSEPPTDKLADRKTDETHERPPQKTSQVNPREGIALLVRGHDSPLVVAADEFVLGRYDPDMPQDGVDLMPYGGGSMGVSRRHARILRKGGIYIIEDLNSTNGTWVNRHRLASGSSESLQDGDIIQLGQLVMRLYFDTEEALYATEERITFRSPSAQLTPQYLSQRVSPYLLALAEVQGIGDVIRERESAIEISGISVDSDALITVQISGARDALKLAKGRVKTWRDANMNNINQFLRMKQTLRKETHILMENIGPASSTDEVAARELGRALREAEKQLVREFLRELIPYQSADDLEPHVEGLIEHVHVLAFSPMDIVSSSPTPVQS